MGEELESVVHETELKPVVKAGWEEIHKMLDDKLTNLAADIETKVNEYREQLLNESNDTKTRLENMIEDCTEVVEVEIPEITEEEPVETEETEENNYIGE